MWDFINDGLVKLLLIYVIFWLVQQIVSGPVSPDEHRTAASWPPARAMKAA